jgi:hypothetical protein
LQTRGTGPDAGAAGTDLLLPPAVVEHDPWLSLAQARRRVREGALTAAVDRFRRAESLLDEPDFRDDCQRERSVAAMWASSDTTGMSWAVDGRGSARHWSIPIRLATRRLGAARVAPPALTGSTPAPHELARGIISLLAGDFRDARRTLDAVVADRAAESTHRLLADLTIAVIDLIRDRPGDPASRLGQIALDAEVAGLPWIARLARGLGECVLAATDPAAWRLAACVDQIDECDEAGDACGRGAWICRRGRPLPPAGCPGPGPVGAGVAGLRTGRPAPPGRGRVGRPGGHRGARRAGHRGPGPGPDRRGDGRGAGRHRAGSDRQRTGSDDRPVHRAGRAHPARG